MIAEATQRRDGPDEVTMGELRGLRGALNELATAFRQQQSNGDRQSRPVRLRVNRNERGLIDTIDFE